MMTDPIADMLTRIRNANRISRKTITMPASKLKVGIAGVLQDEGFLTSYRVEEGKPSATLTLELKYGPDGEHVIRTIDRVSKPGRRIYMGAKEIPKVLRGLGIYVLSTPKGVVSDRTARAENVGGEILCKVF
jgi:small subunit ribosomal protein S8